MSLLKMAIAKRLGASIDLRGKHEQLINAHKIKEPKIRYILLC